MKPYLIVLLILTPLFCFSQSYFNKDRAKVKKELEHFISKNSILHPSLKETDSTLMLETEVNPGKKIQVVFAFDQEKGHCNSQRTVTYCDACYLEEVNKLLAQKSYQWKKLNENQYASRYEDHLLLELRSEETDFSFTLFKTNWSRDFYELLTRE